MNTLSDLDLNGKKVIIRCDLNVPIENGKITDENRLVESIPTIKYVLERAKNIIILSHLGRINNNIDIKKNTLEPICRRLSILLGTNIEFCSYDDDIKNKIEKNKIVMLENTRYFDIDNKKESNNDLSLAKFFASLADVFVNDAFGVCHRSAASTVGIAKLLPSCGGFLIEKEMKALDTIKNDPIRPFTIILGGSKVSDKIGIISNLIDKVDKLVIVGGMAFTFLKARNINIGNSILDNDNINYAKNLLDKYNKKIILPIDVYTSLEFSNNSDRKLKDIENISSHEIGLDIGPKTIQNIYDNISNSKTIFVNGPAGAFEFSNFSYGTKMIFEILSNIDCDIIVGGGDTAYAALKFGYKDKFKHISTGGGASLEYLEGKDLPGIKCLCGKL